MLIWYANIPEETVYFKQRVHGPYKGIFFINLIVGFIAPLLILMRRAAKRNYTLVAVMACVIIFIHWVDFFQMTQPGVVNNYHHNHHDVKGDHFNPVLSWFEFGIALGFIGTIMLVVGNALAKAPLLAKNHPFTKESIIHHT
jgi:Ni/Fe-hydrogenase subunit HybB-like protein